MSYPTLRRSEQNDLSVEALFEEDISPKLNKHSDKKNTYFNSVNPYGFGALTDISRKSNNDINGNNDLYCQNNSQTSNNKKFADKESLGFSGLAKSSLISSNSRGISISSKTKDNSIKSNFSQVSENNSFFSDLKLTQRTKEFIGSPDNNQFSMSRISDSSITQRSTFNTMAIMSNNSNLEISGIKASPFKNVSAFSDFININTNDSSTSLRDSSLSSRSIQLDKSELGSLGPENIESSLSLCSSPKTQSQKLEQCFEVVSNPRECELSKYSIISNARCNNITTKQLVELLESSPTHQPEDKVNVNECKIREVFYNNEKKYLVLIDCRSKSEFQNGHIEYALHRPFLSEFFKDYVDAYERVINEFNQKKNETKKISSRNSADICASKSLNQYFKSNNTKYDQNPQSFIGSPLNSSCRNDFSLNSSFGNTHLSNSLFNTSVDLYPNANHLNSTNLSFLNTKNINGSSILINQKVIFVLYGNDKNDNRPLEISLKLIDLLRSLQIGLSQLMTKVPLYPNIFLYEEGYKGFFANSSLLRYMAISMKNKSAFTYSSKIPEREFEVGCLKNEIDISMDIFSDTLDNLKRNNQWSPVGEKIYNKAKEMTVKNFNTNYKKKNNNDNKTYRPSII